MNVRLLSFSTVIALSALLSPIDASASNTVKGAVLGAGIGVVSGKGIKGALGGAVLGAGVGAVTEQGQDGKNARKGARTGLLLGAGVGLLSGKGVNGALKGALVGAAAGAVVGKVTGE